MKFTKNLIYFIMKMRGKQPVRIEEETYAIFKETG